MRTVLVLFFLLLMVFFALENQTETTVILGPFAVTQSVAIVVITTFIIGVIIGRTVPLSRSIQSRITKSS